MAAPTLSLEEMFAGLLEPIPGENPGGRNLRYGPEHAAVLTARREDDASLPTGVWERSTTRADWDEVVKLCRKILIEDSKDLQAACWLAEAAWHVHELKGLPPGLVFIHDFLETFWGDAYPEHEDDRDSPRFSPILWLDNTIATLIQTMPIVRHEADGVTYSISTTAYSLAQKNFAAMRRDNAEAATKSKPAKLIAVFRDQSLKLSRTTVHGWLADLEQSIEETRKTDALFDAKAGTDAPQLTRLRSAADELKTLLSPITAKLPEPPKPIPAAEAAKAQGDDGDFDETDMVDTALAATLDEEVPQMDAPKPAPKPAGVPPAVLKKSQLIESRAEAYQALRDIAAFLKEIEPHSLTPALVDRAVRWGGMSLAEVMVEMSREGRDMGTIQWLLDMPKD